MQPYVWPPDTHPRHLDTQPLDMPSTPLDIILDTPRHTSTCVHVPSGLTASTQSLTLTSTQPRHHLDTSTPGLCAHRQRARLRLLLRLPRQCGGQLCRGLNRTLFLSLMNEPQRSSGVFEHHPNTYEHKRTFANSRCSRTEGPLARFS